ncbi:MAG: hypothetical protein EPO02_13065 [Nitrospirae bacterium]|nr:MAG: hypothetical protein EPO02_13065 [Nitrospirota bacterium]
MSVEIQIDGVRAVLGEDPEMSMLWTSPNPRLASDLNRWERFPYYSDLLYTPTPQISEAEACVKWAHSEGKQASIVADNSPLSQAAAAGRDYFDPSVLY